MRFIERTHKSDGLHNILVDNPITFFCLASSKNIQTSAPFDESCFFKVLVKNNILKKKISSKISSFIKGACYLVFPLNMVESVTAALKKWFDSLEINLLFVKWGVRYYSPLILSAISKDILSELVSIIFTLNFITGKFSIFLNKVGAFICKPIILRII
tara:strand:+ start:148 stop:621 length:474 start_codon:yes stop_codon:yes gene_type:complete